MAAFYGETGEKQYARKTHGDTIIILNLDHTIVYLYQPTGFLTMILL